MLQQLIPVSDSDLLSHRPTPGAACHDGARTEPLAGRCTDDDSDSPEMALTDLREEFAAHHEQLRAFMVSPRFGNPAYVSEFHGLLREGDSLYTRLAVLLPACSAHGASGTRTGAVIGARAGGRKALG